MENRDGYLSDNESDEKALTRLDAFRNAPDIRFWFLYQRTGGRLGTDYFRLPVFPRDLHSTH